MTVRALERADAAAYRALRLRALREHPEAFVAVYEDEAVLPIDHFADRITPSASSRVFGGFVAHVLSGAIGISRFVAPKPRHRAHIWGMYVAPDARGHGVGRALLDAALDIAGGWDGVELVSLSVSEASGPARALYVSAGFVPWGITADAVRVAGARITRSTSCSGSGDRSPAGLSGAWFRISDGCPHARRLPASPKSSPCKCSARFGTLRLTTPTVGV